LYDQEYPDAEIIGMDADIDTCPTIDPNNMRVRVYYHSAACLIHAPNDPSGPGGMRREYIQATPNWRKGESRHDCVLVDGNPAQDGFRGFNVGHVHFSFSFEWRETIHQCAFIHWFELADEQPCPLTGLWMVRPQVNARRERICSVIHIDSIYAPVHLMGYTGNASTPGDVIGGVSLHAFRTYYVNKYANSHLFELLN
jgi:hypothetical protein